MPVIAISEYKYRPGYSVRGVSAQVVGETVETLRQARGGDLPPRDLVEESEPEDAPLHGAFEWDDDIAAPKWREEQARRIIRSVVEIRVNPRTGEKHEGLAFVSRYAPEQSYTGAVDAFSDPELRARIIAHEQSLLDGWLQRNKDINELAGLVDAIQAAVAAQRTAEARRRNRGKRKPRDRDDQPRA